MPREYDVTNWYWIVGGDRTRVFSSAVGDYVPHDSAAFATWVSEGGLPTNIDTEANLGEVLTQGRQRPQHASVLRGYKKAHARGMVIKVDFKVIYYILKELHAIKNNGAVLTAEEAVDVLEGLM